MTVRFVAGWFLVQVGEKDVAYGSERNAGRGLAAREYVAVASMLFGLFFGAGNLIFPIHMGQLAGSNVWLAVAGFAVTGVGIPILAVAALGISHSDGLLSLASRVGRRYGLAFTCVLYLTIGPLFAIPRCATVAFTVGVAQVLPADASQRLWLLGFSTAFFAVTLALSLRPGKILTWVGKVLTPAFLVFLGVLVVTALVNPAASVADVAPRGSYVGQPLVSGLLEGYNTMDALAGLAFGIVVVGVIRDLGVTDPDVVASSTVRSGVLSGALMVLVYAAVSVVGAQSRGALAVSDNGGIAFAQIARLYLGDAGLLVLAVTVTLACLKTAVGLVTSCSEAFVQMFPRAGGYRRWAVGFSLASLLFSNWGLDTIIAYAVPVLMLLYPLAIVLVVLALTQGLHGGGRAVYAWSSGLTLVGAAYGMLASLPAAARATLGLDGFLAGVGELLPLSSVGFGWVCPAVLGLVIGIVRSHRVG